MAPTASEGLGKEDSMRLGVWVTAMCGLTALGCQQSGTTTEGSEGPVGTGSGLGEREGAIINGVLETGYPHIGALTQWWGNQYGGSFCTATLITPTWVITAAHCLEDQSSSNVRFYIGNDSRHTANGSAPTNGSFYRAAALHSHPNYNRRTLENDIALVQLQNAVPANIATPMAYSTVNLAPYQGQNAFYVGFGQTNGFDEYSSGVKYSTSFAISQVYSTQFRSVYNGTGTCFGDSGGPAIININGVPSVVGVTSSGEAPSSPNGDPCKTASYSTRVDKYATWIAGKLGAPPPDCRQDAGLCACPEACGANGSCNDSVCAVATCEATYDCVIACETEACLESCYAAASPTATQQLDAMFACLESRCGNATTDAQFQTCAQQQCGSEIDTCFGFGSVGTGNDTCEEVYDCLVGCTTNACATACYGEGTAAAQGQIDTLLTCFETNCGNVSEAQFPACAGQYCQAPIDACFGATLSCNPVGGDCDDGEACYPTTGGGFACFPTADKALGAACNPNANDLECVDGAACVGTEGSSSGECVSFCRTNSQCGGAVCDLSLTGVTGLGLCEEAVTCVDVDRDGTCADRDCNDNDASVKPGVAEICDNGKDDNCNGQQNEGCATSGCTDEDQDGVCAENDCNDNDATIRPNGSERCGDGVDNNCNGQTDEGCEGCTDNDQDGYCAGVDCNDQSASVNPTVIESCGDNVDNNCNGQTDENCTNNPNNPNNPGVGGSSRPSGCATGGWQGFAGFAGFIGFALVWMRRKRQQT